MPSLLIQSASLEFVFHLASDPPGSGPVPAVLESQALAACDRLFGADPFKGCCRGLRVCSGDRLVDAVSHALSFAQFELDDARLNPGIPKPVIEMPPLDASDRPIWRPVGPIHQVIGRVLKIEGGTTPWWSVPLADGPNAAIAFLCCRMSFRKLEG